MRGHLWRQVPPRPTVTCTGFTHLTFFPFVSFSPLPVTKQEEAAYFEVYKKELYDSVAKKFPLLSRAEVRVGKGGRRAD